MRIVKRVGATFTRENRTYNYVEKNTYDYARNFDLQLLREIAAGLGRTRTITRKMSPCNFHAQASPLLRWRIVTVSGAVAAREGSRRLLTGQRISGSDVWGVKS
jgi:hypothetical protein